MNAASLTDEEISRLVAEKVMEWEYEMVCDNCFADGSECKFCNGKGYGGNADEEWLYGDGAPGIDFSITTPAHSDMIIDKLVDDYSWLIYQRADNKWTVKCTPKFTVVVPFKLPTSINESRHRAIALAALAAVKGIEG